MFTHIKGLSATIKVKDQCNSKLYEHEVSLSIIHSSLNKLFTQVLNAKGNKIRVCYCGYTWMGGGCRHDSPFAPSPLSYSIGMRYAPSVQSREYIASSPGPSQLFSLAGKKRERAWYLKSRDKRWQKGVVLALPHNVDFTPVWHLWSTKRSSARPLRIVPPSLIVSVAFSFTRIEPERSKIALAHTQFSRSATLPTLVYGPTSRT